MTDTGQTVLENEEWRPCADHPGLEVSSLGRVRSWRSSKSKKSGEPQLLRGSIDGNGYPRVSVGRWNGGIHHRPIHVLVATAFCVRLPGHAVVRHLNDDRADSRATNLAWGSRADNTADAIANGRIIRGAQHPSAELSDSQVREIYQSSETTSECGRRFGIHGAYVSQIRHRRVRREATEGLGPAPGAVGMGGYHRGRGRTITKEIAVEIYTSPEPHAVLARRHGISMTHVLRIRQGKKWRSVTSGLPQPQYGQSIAGVRVDEDGNLTGKSLTAEQAIEIFTSPARGRDMAEKFNVTESVVSSIRKGCAWRHVTQGLTQPDRPTKWKQLAKTAHHLGS